MRDLRMYILVNKDIEISKGKLAGQVGHACNCYTYHNYGSELLDEYMKGSIKKIILHAPQKLLEELEDKGYLAIRDNGLTEQKPKTLTCVNYGIIDYADIKEHKILKRLQLVK